MDAQIERLFLLMRSESNRLKSFQMNPAWPKDYINVEKLAKAGLFYLFRGDQVCCAFCHGLMSHWNDPDVDPMSRHVKSFICCPFIMGAEVGNKPLGQDPLPGPKKPAPAYDVFGSNRTRQQLYDESRSSSEQYSSFLPDPFGGGVGAALSNSQDDTQLSQSSLESIPIDDYYQHSPQPYDEASLKNNRDHSLDSSAAVGGNPTRQSHASDGICKVCYMNPIELVFLPCSHSMSCQSCAQRLDECPHCRAPIITRIRIYLH